MSDVATTALVGLILDVVAILYVVLWFSFRHRFVLQDLENTRLRQRQTEMEEAQVHDHEAISELQIMVRFTRAMNSGSGNTPPPMPIPTPAPAPSSRPLTGAPVGQPQYNNQYQYNQQQPQGARARASRTLSGNHAGNRVDTEAPGSAFVARTDEAWLPAPLGDSGEMQTRWPP